MQQPQSSLVLRALNLRMPAQLHQTAGISGCNVVGIGGIERSHFSVEDRARHRAVGQIVDPRGATASGRVVVKLEFEAWNLLEQPAWCRVDPLPVNQVAGVVITHPRFDSPFGRAEPDCVEKLRQVAHPPRE